MEDIPTELLELIAYYTKPSTVRVLSIIIPRLDYDKMKLGILDNLRDFIEADEARAKILLDSSSYLVDRVQEMQDELQNNLLVLLLHRNMRLTQGNFIRILKLPRFKENLNYISEEDFCYFMLQIPFRSINSDRYRLYFVKTKSVPFHIAFSNKLLLERTTEITSQEIAKEQDDLVQLLVYEANFLEGIGESLEDDLIQLLVYEANFLEGIGESLDKIYTAIITSEILLGKYFRDDSINVIRDRISGLTCENILKSKLGILEY